MAAVTNQRALIGSPRRSAMTPIARAASAAIRIHKSLRARVIARHCCGIPLLAQAGSESGSHSGFPYPELRDDCPPPWDEKHPIIASTFPQGCDPPRSEESIYA